MAGIAISSFLPTPKYQQFSTAEGGQAVAPRKRASRSRAPAYGKRQQSGWVPRCEEDFGDGGAFPEVHVAQFPLGMGKKSGTKPNTLAVQVDSEGKLRYDAIAKAGRSEGAKVYASPTDLVAMSSSKLKEDDLARPNDETIQEELDATRLALEKRLNSKIASDKFERKGQHMTAHTEKEGPTYIRYTPANSNASHNSGAPSRIIRMVEMPRDPLEPPKFQIKKIPKGPGSPPVPVMHSPPRKLTREDQQAWVIPPVISNWKNPKGYTIPLDKRLAADGRGLQEVQINDNFASLSEALYIAERKAREEVEKRNAVQKKMAMREREEQEKKLRQLAQSARMDKATLGERDGAGERKRDRASRKQSSGSDSESDGDDQPARKRMRASDKFEKDDAAKEREQLREERRRQRERELRMNKRAPANREKDRDISEKIALGMAQPTQSSEAMYDSRLFNQSKGLDSGFGANDSYNVYSKPLFHDREETHKYRPKKGMEDEAVRTKPVEFERKKEDADPLAQLESFMEDAKKAEKKK